MNRKLSQKLFIYFLITVLIFSLFSGLLFLYFGQKTTLNSYSNILLDRANSIANSITDNSMFTTPNMGMQRRNSSSNFQGISQGHVRWMNQVLESDIWIIDKSNNTIIVGENRTNIDFNSLNEDQIKVVEKAFSGEESVSHDFANIFSDSVITVSVPIEKDGTILGAVLLHEEVSLRNEIFSSGISVFILSIAIGLVLAGLLSFYFSKRFVKPILELNDAVQEMTEDNYDTKIQTKSNDELGNLARNLENLSQRLENIRIERENLDQMRNDFISNVSHELRTPVTVIKSSLELLESGAIRDQESINSYYDILKNESIVLENLINDLMELSVLKNPTFPMNFEDQNFAEILADAIRSQRITAREKNIEIINNLSSHILPIKGDYTRLRQMIITILNNSIKFSPQGEKVKIYEEKVNDKVKITINNQGEVIPEKDIDKLFQSFYRSKDTKEKGFGLGLAIAKEIADRHNIELQVESNEDEGTSFSFIF